MPWTRAAARLPGPSGGGEGERLAGAGLAHHDVDARTRGRDALDHLHLFVREQLEPAEGSRQRCGLGPATAAEAHALGCVQHRAFDGQQLEGGVAQLAAPADTREGDDVRTLEQSIGDRLDHVRRSALADGLGHRGHDVAALEGRDSRGQPLGPGQAGEQHVDLVAARGAPGLLAQEVVEDAVAGRRRRHSELAQLARASARAVPARSARPA